MLLYFKKNCDIFLKTVLVLCSILNGGSIYVFEEFTFAVTAYVCQKMKCLCTAVFQVNFSLRNLLLTRSMWMIYYVFRVSVSSRD